MSDESDDDKTEAATEKKLREAAERGDAPVSREASLFAGLLATLAVSALVLRDNASALADTLGRIMEDPARFPLATGTDATLLLRVLAGACATFVTPVFAIFLVSGLGVSFAQSAPTFVLSRIAPKPSKLSPAAGLSRLFGRAGLFEFAKGAFKLLVVGLVGLLILRSEQDGIADMLFVSPATIPDRMLGIFVRLLSGVATAFVLLAGADLVWARISWTQRMRMSRREIKDEVKQAEGDPFFKAKRRSLALDRSRRRMIADVPRATLVIANPTHFAIALRYVRGEGSAPLVVAKGQDLLALKIREIATENAIAIIENKPLARSMYDHVEVSKTIPPQFFKAVAEIIHYIQSRDAARSSPQTTPVSR